LSNSLKSATGKLYPLKCDVTKETEITEAFKWIKAKVGGVDILVNNAGVATFNSLTGKYMFPPMTYGRKLFLKTSMHKFINPNNVFSFTDRSGIWDGVKRLFSHRQHPTSKNLPIYGSQNSSWL
jgi:NAD(P)-dependent dehydrogenase (short-subunit alcohol dehydrogenase family)